MEKLAIHGGKAVREKDFSSWPQFDNLEAEALHATLQQGSWWRGEGSQISKFEESFAEYEGGKKAIAVTNGTHSLELALKALEIMPGDEVIVPAITFMSTAFAVQSVGAVPIPVDVELDTFNISAKSAQTSLTEKVKAIICVHMGGEVCDVPSLKKLASTYGIPLIQDSAHAPGARWENHGLGEFEALSTYSFQNSKLITAGEGGAVVFYDEELYRKAFLIHNCGRLMNDSSYQHSTVSSNYRMTEFQAAVLRVQLQRLDRQINIRNNNYNLFANELRSNTYIRLQQSSMSCSRNPKYMVLFTLSEALTIHRDEFVRALIAEGIPANRAYRPLYQAKSFFMPPSASNDTEFWAQKCPNSELIGERAIWIHHRVLVGSEQDALDVAEAINKVCCWLIK
jgi:3-amino-5-hydroxybenzoate synthase